MTTTITPRRSGRGGGTPVGRGGGYPRVLPPPPLPLDCGGSSPLPAHTFFLFRRRATTP